MVASAPSMGVETCAVVLVKTGWMVFAERVVPTVRPQFLGMCLSFF
jgi:hypothetical protein